MSAQAVLSMIAPALPAAPQGAAGADAMAFQGLLASLLGSGGEQPPTPQPSDDEATNVQDAIAIAGTLITLAVPAAAPFVLVAETVAPALLSELPDSDPASGVLEPDVGPGQGLAPPVTPQSAAPTAPTASSAATPAPVQPPVPAAEAKAETAQAELAPPPPTDPKADTPKAATAAQTQTSLMTADAGRGATPPPPAPLRPHSDRAIRALDAATSAERAGSGETRSPGAPTTSVGSPQTQTGAPTLSDASPRPDAVIANNPDAAGPETAEAPAGEGQTAEPAAPSTAAQVREAPVSNLSRGALEATAQIAAQIQRRLEGRNTRFEMALTPDDLGRVDVKLDIDSEGRLSARLAFDNPAAAADLRGRTDELRRQLEDAGFHVADDAFEFADRDSGSSAFDRGQDARDGQGRAFARANQLNIETDAVALAPRWTTLSLTPAGVDMKV